MYRIRLKYKILFLSVLLTNSTFADWTQLVKPRGGSVDFVKVNKNNEQVIYSVLSSKIYKTMNGGIEWFICYESSSLIEFLEIAPSNQNEIYTNTSKSIDNGESWTQIYIPTHSGFGIMQPKMAIDPYNSDILFAADYEKIYKSFNGGLDWTEVAPISVIHIMYDDQNSTVLYAFNISRVYRSNDNGVSWELVYEPTENEYYYDAAISQQNIYLIRGPISGPHSGANSVIKSTDQGETWVDLGFSQEDYNFTQITDILVIEGNIYVTTDRGLFFSEDDGGIWTRISSDYDYLTSVVVSNNIIVSSEYNGVSSTPTDELNWRNIGVTPLENNHINIISSSNGITLLSSYYGLYKYLPENSIWRTIVPPSGNYAYHYEANFSKEILNRVYVVQYNKLFVSDNSGDSWNFISELPDNIALNGNSDLSLDDSKQFYSNGSNIIRTLNSGTSWSVKQTPGNTLYDLHYSDLGKLYILDDTGLYISENDGNDFQVLDVNFPDNYVIIENTISFDNSNNDRLFCTIGTPGPGYSDLYEKPSGSNSWTLMYDIDDITFKDKIVTDPESNDLYVFGGISDTLSWTYGLLKSQNNGNSWQVCTEFVDFNTIDYGFQNFEPYLLWYINNTDVLWLGDVQNMSGLEIVLNDNQISSYSLLSVYPNPFNSNITINYTVNKGNSVNIAIYDITGQLITSLVNDVKSIGEYTTKWNANSYSSGVYFCKLSVGDNVEVKKLTLVK